MSIGNIKNTFTRRAVLIVVAVPIYLTVLLVACIVAVTEEGGDMNRRFVASWK